MKSAIIDAFREKMAQSGTDVTLNKLAEQPKPQITPRSKPEQPTSATTNGTTASTPTIINKPTTTRPAARRAPKPMPIQPTITSS